MSRHVRPMLAACVVALLLPGYVHAQVAPTPDQSFLTLMASGDRGMVMLTGRDLASFAKATIVPVNRGAGVIGISATLGAVTRTGLPLTISTTGGTVAGDYYIDLVTTRGVAVRIDVTLTVEAADAPPVIDAVDAPTTVIQGAPVSVTVSASDDLGLATIQVSWPGGTARARLAGSLTAKEAVAIIGLTAGIHSLDVVVTDGAGNQSDVQTVTIDVVELALTGFTLSSPTVEGGQGVTGTVTLGAVAPSAQTITLDAGMGSATVPASVTVPAGAQSATFAVTTQATAAENTATLTATLGAAQMQAALTVLAPPPVVPSSIAVGVFTFAIEPLALPQPFSPVTVAAGAFTFAIEPLAVAAPFTPRVIQVGSFLFVIQPLQTGGN